MKMKILGNQNQYYDQTNDASIDLIKQYTGKREVIACGPNMAAMNCDIAGCNMGIFTPGEQASDAILNVFHNPFNAQNWKRIRDIDYDKYSENEVPQLYPQMTRIIWGEEKCLFAWGITRQAITTAINADAPIGVAVKMEFGGHYISIVGYKEDQGNFWIIYNDPYPRKLDRQPHQSPGDPVGYQRRMLYQDFSKISVESGRDFMLVFPKQ